MTSSVIFGAILDRLNADATLMTLLGKTVGDAPCFRAQRKAPISTPSVTLRITPEPSELFCGTDNAISTPLPNALLATNSPTIQLDIWVSSESSSTPNTGQDADAIEARIDVLLRLNTLGWKYYDSSGNLLFRTHGWRRITTSQQYEDDTSLWHNVVRYEFWYLIKQGYGLT
jgi:hypothetical protein